MPSILVLIECCTIFTVLAAGFEPAASPFAGERSVHAELREVATMG